MQGRFDTAFRLLLTGDPFRVGQTPSDVVYTEGQARLLRYRPVTSSVSMTPLLLLPSLFNHSYVLDLMPGQSMVEYLLGRGIDVYLFDWGTGRRDDRFVTLDQYITGYLRRAVQRVRATSNQETVNLLGYSFGGTLAAIFAALYPQYVRAMALLAAPVNFHDDGLMSQWMRKDRFNVDLVVDTLGGMPLELLQASFRMLKPTVQIAQGIALAEQLGDTQTVQDFLAMQTWIDDSIPFIGEAYRKYIKECYQENALIHGRLVIDGQRVDLAQVTCSLLVVSAIKDCICPPQSATAIIELAPAPDKQVLELASGHIGVVAGRTALDQLWPYLAGWLIDRGVPATTPTTPDEPPALLPPPADQRRSRRKHGSAES